MSSLKHSLIPLPGPTRLCEWACSAPRPSADRPLPSHSLIHSSTPPPLTFAILAGEASGDTQGALLVDAIRRLEPHSRFVGVGGPQMRSRWVEILFDSSGWGAIGIIESLRLVVPLLRARRELLRYFIAHRPDLLIPIDFGFFNVRLAAELRARGLKVLYYFPPRSWSRDAYVSPRLRSAVDAVATPFPWSAERFQDAGVPAEFIGHPLLDTLQEAPTREELCREWGLDPARPVVALLPGSRGHEIKYLWPELIAAARQLSSTIPGIQFLTPVAPTVRPGVLQRALTEAGWARFEETDEERWQPPASSPNPATVLPTTTLLLVPGRTGDVLAASDVVATCSGTATLEAAVRLKPMIILYRGSPLMNLEWKLRRPRLKVPYIGMPNLIAGEEIVPEYIQEDATAGRVASELLSLLQDQDRASHMRERLRQATAVLGEPGAIARAARMAVSLARDQAPQM